MAPASASDVATVERLRARLSRRKESLYLLRKRIAAARESGLSASRPLSSVGDISRRFMNAAAESEARGERKGPVVVQREGGGVGSLLSKWNQGFEMKEAEKERVSVRGNVGRAKDMFSKQDTRLEDDVGRMKRQARGKAMSGGGNGGFIAVEEDDVPSWAINQSARVVVKEDPTARTGGVNVNATRNNVMNRGSAEIDTSGVRESAPRGNVGGVLAMWDKKADDQEARERAEALRAETMRSIRADFGARSSTSRTSGSIETVPEPEPVELEEVQSEESFEDSDEEEEEPTDIRELVVYLEDKVERTEKKIARAEQEMEQLEAQMH